jgi:DNA-binding response OmpR family regulator
MTNDKHVLIVDDEEELVRGISLWLTKAGFDTFVAHDADEAVAAAQTRQPDAVVLDVRMPGRDGLSALKELRNSPATMHIPVVMLSASLIDQQRALDAGARYFLSKPYEGKELIAAVTAAINDPTLSEERHERAAPNFVR